MSWMRPCGDGTQAYRKVDTDSRRGRRRQILRVLGQTTRAFGGAMRQPSSCESEVWPFDGLVAAGRAANSTCGNLRARLLPSRRDDASTLVATAAEPRNSEMSYDEKVRDLFD
jgi:hypothetical protein